MKASRLRAFGEILSSGGYSLLKPKKRNEPKGRTVIGLYRKRPVVIQAVQIDSLDYDGMIRIVAWCGGRAIDDGSDAVIAIDTLEGTMNANHGTWILKGVAGEFYPCAPEIFAATYEEIDDIADVLDYYSIELES